MKGFRSTGNGPRSGFSFPSKGGFGPSSGKVKSISGYTRKSPRKMMKKAIGGIVEDNIVEAPGFSDFSKGGVLKKAEGGKISANDMRKKLGAQFTQREYDEIQKKSALKKYGPQLTKREYEATQKKAKGGKVEGVSDPMSATEAMKHSRGGRAFNRTPKIGK